MSQRRVNETSLTATADALRAKLGTFDPIPWVENEGFKEAVESIQTDSGGADVSGVTATETEVLENAIFVDAHGEYKEGIIPRNGDTSTTFDGIDTKSVEIPAGYTTGGKVELDGTIDNAVEAAKTSLVNKGVDVPTDTDVRGLAGLIDSISEAGGGGELQELDVTPSHEAQEFIPAEGVAGYKKVTVKPVPRLPFAAVSVTGGSPVADFESVVNISTGVEVTWEKYYTHFLYNGVRLPRIPDALLEDYPYAWIRNNTTTGYYDLIMSDTPYYYQSSALYEGAGVQGLPYYRVPISDVESATKWTTYGSHTFNNWGLDSARTVLWSNHDIPNGSATATDIYFEGTEPVPVD